ncbi:MAG TPA: spore coat protein [Limnochordia bacterium]|nr:spore coat protein [Limnochordia bacterium]
MNSHTRSYGGYQQHFSGSTNPTIKNPTTQVPQSTQFNDRDCLNDILAMEKWLTDGFNVFAREASHQALHNDVMHILNETHRAARDVFNLMFEKGWYSLHPEQPEQVAKEHQKFQSYESQMPQQRTSPYESGGMYQPRQY